jgi:hypothetical protein
VVLVLVMLVPSPAHQVLSQRWLLLALLQHPHHFWLALC